MASVWSATNIFTEREFAMKFMLPQVARTPESAHRFLLEAKVSARIDHPNIINIIDVGQAEDGVLFLVMELLTGMSLDSAIRRQKPPLLVYEFILLMQEVAQALAAAHKSGVIHRDLKPTNIFLHKDRDGRVVAKILDFGVSKILEEESSTALTVVGTVLGSPQYMSPEQAMGEAGIDGRTDVFAFGSMLFEALVGQRAYDGMNFNALIVAIATKQPKSIDALAPHIPAGLRALVRDCMVTDKAKRLASFDRIVERLDGMLAELSKSDLRITPRTRSETPAPPQVASAAAPPQATAPAHPSTSSSGVSSSSGANGPSSSRSPRTTDPARASGPSQARSPSVPLAHGAPGSGDVAPAPPPNPSGLQAPALPQPEMNMTTPAARAWTQVTKDATAKWTSQPMALVAGGGGALLLAALVGGLILAFSRGHTTGQATAASPSSPPAPPPAVAAAPVAPKPSAVTAAPTTTDGNDVPVISVDSLPVAARGAIAKGNGRLIVVSTPSSCAVSVDGVSHGMTPLNGFELNAGLHKIDCVSSSGKTHAVSVAVAEGGSTRYRFTLDE